MPSPKPRGRSGRSSPVTIVSALGRKYAQMRGEFEVAEQEIEHVHGLNEITEATLRVDRRKRELEENMASLEAVIWLFDAKWDPSIVDPLYPRQVRLKPGAISRAALRVLRHATQPMTTREIARIVWTDLDKGAVDEREMAGVDSAIVATLERKIGTTIKLHAGPPRRWSVKRAEDVVAEAAAAREARLQDAGAASSPTGRARRAA